MARPRRNFVLGVMAAFWVAAMGWGFAELWIYSNAPGVPGEPPQRWPEASSLETLPDRNTVVVFLHPRCPCSESSLEELARLMPHIQDQAQLHLVFYHPETFPESWVRAGLWETAEKMPGVVMHIDSSGREIARFQPKTSGQLYLYSKEKDLIYSGGITASRGHAGDNSGRTAVLTWFEEARVTESRGNVFGCSLFHEGGEHDL